MMMGPNAGKMPVGGFGGPMGMQGQFDQSGRPIQQPQAQQNVKDLRNEIMGMIHKTNAPMGGNQDMSNIIICLIEILIFFEKIWEEECKEKEKICMDIWDTQE